MTHYDLVVIGTGSGNTIVDDALAHLKVAIVERATFGGTCLNRGCIPSKMFIHPADLVDEARSGPRFGVATSYPGREGADWPAIRDRIFGRIDPNSRGGKEYREGLDHVDVLTGTARFTGPGALEVDLVEGGQVAITADQVVLAAGSRPVVPPIEGIEDVEVHTSDTIMRLDTLPERLVVVGGGYVGAELAHVFSSLGTRVVQIEGEAQLLAGQDADVAELFTTIASERWEVRLNAKAERFENRDGAIVAHLSDGSSVETDVLLMAVGRAPNSDVLDLDVAGIRVDDAGRVVVDQHQRTCVEGVWALGDLSSHEPLKHVANQDARVVQHNLLHPEDLMVSDHRFVPSAVFTSPQISSVGLTEQAAREQGIDLAVGRHDYADIAHGWALEEDDSGHFVKLLGDRATGRLVGAHLIGPDASNLLQPLIMAMSFDIPVRGLARGQYWIHPTLAEVVENALLALEKDL